MDKLLHFLAGYIIANITTYFYGWEIGVAMSIIAGALKELYDSTGRGEVDFWDFMYTIFGGVLNALIWHNF